MVDSKLMRWCVNHGRTPMRVEVLEFLGGDCWIVEGENGVFEAYGHQLFWDENDAWRAYAEFLEGVKRYLEEYPYAGLAGIIGYTRDRIEIANSKRTRGDNHGLADTGRIQDGSEN